MEWMPQTGKAEFQFTHPGRGATLRDIPFPVRFVVSIHAPREGCDSLALCRRIGSLEFQFTHPGRGATPLDT